MDEVVVFNQLTNDDLRKIASLMLDEISAALEEQGYRLGYTDAAIDLLLDLNDRGKYGARDLRRIIRKHVEDKIADVLLTAGNESSRNVMIDAENGELKVAVE